MAKLNEPFNSEELKTDIGDSSNFNANISTDTANSTSTEIMQPPPTPEKIPIPEADKVDVPPVEPVISTKELTDSTAPVTPTFNRGALVDNIQKTLKTSPRIVANDPFVSGALKLAGIKATPENIAKYSGQRVGDIINELGIGGEFENFGIQEPEPTESEKARTAFFDKAKTEEEPEKPKSAVDMLNSLSDEADDIAAGEGLSEAGLEAQVEIGNLTEQLNNLTQTFDANKALASVEAQDLKDQFEQLKDDTNIGATGRSIILGESAQAINDKITGMNSQQVRDLATYTLTSIPLSNALLRAQGEYNAAVEQQRASSASMRWAFERKLDIAERTDKITRDQAVIAQQEFNNEMDLSDRGFVEIPEGRLEQDRADIASGLKDGVIITNPVNGKSYWRDAALEEADIDTQIVETKNSDGSTTKTLINSQTGDPIKVVGVSDPSGKDVDYNAAELDAATFATRVQSANNIFDEIEAEVAPLLTGKFSIQRTLPDRFKNKTVLRQEQAERDFVTAVLRRESGAAISDEEFKTARQIYFPQAGDTTEVLNQKRISRQTALDGLERSSKGAFQSGQDYFSFYSSLPPEQRNSADALQEEYGMGDTEFFEFIQEQGAFGFSQVGSDTNKASGYVSSVGKITGFGSPMWEYGLDVDLAKGDPVKSPISGKVVKVGDNGGFGKQVQIQDPSGNTIWLSHLDGFDVRAGQTVSSGQLVGKGGNTGSTIPGVGGDGSHLDITIKKPDGSYMSARQVNNYLA